VKEGYVFDAWYTSLSMNEKFTLEKMPGHDVTIYANWIVGRKVTFDANAKDGSVNIGYIYLANGKTFGFYGKLPTPVREGHTFNGWYTDPDAGIVVTEETPFSSSTEMTLYAHWTVNEYTIQFESNGGSKVPAIKYKYGENIILPYYNVKKDGFVLEGWYLNELCTEKVTFSKMPANNLILYANWVASFRVALKCTGCGNLDTETIYLAPGMTYGSLFENSELPEPTKEGHTFKGWFTEEVGGTQIQATDSFSGTGPISIYAQWKVNRYSISYNTNGGTAVPSKKYDYGETITTPTNVEKEGYTFDGWFLESGLIHAMNLTTMPARDLTLYARWKKAIVVDEKDVWDILEIVFGTVITGIVTVGGILWTALSWCCAQCAESEKLQKANLLACCDCGWNAINCMREKQGKAPIPEEKRWKNIRKAQRAAAAAAAGNNSAAGAASSSAGSNATSGTSSSSGGAVELNHVSRSNP